ncbi:MAG: TerC/Alx family metal homeostasis membrane protein [Deltaproteobacteria bacterium]|nr:TerC/Alx family metal homeostasis membrane protein [Deltaproteobacteria bacterium]
MSPLDLVPWLFFLALIGVVLAFDLGVFKREAHAITFGEALTRSVIYISLGLAFNLLVYFLYEHNLFGVGHHVGHPLDGGTAALQFFTGFLLEYSLSLDNVFVIAIIFNYFQIPLAYQHRVLFWGVLGALIMRGIMIALGAALISRFDWIIYVFGGILILTALRMLFSGHENVEPEKSPVVRLARRLYPVTPTLHGEHFFVDWNGRRAATPLFLVLLVVESTDVIFAVDSIPAIFAVTRDPFLVFSSNVFAILGLRSLYFAIAPLMDKFRYLKLSLVFVLAFVGVKMILSHHEPIPTRISLSVIIGILAVGVLASALALAREAGPLRLPGADLDAITRSTLTAARKLIVLVLGATVLVIGAAMVVLPGPALVVIPAGLAILASEFVWARRLLQRLRNEVRSLVGAGKGRGDGSA